MKVTVSRKAESNLAEENSLISSNTDDLYSKAILNQTV